MSGGSTRKPSPVMAPIVVRKTIPAAAPRLIPRRMKNSTAGLSAAARNTAMSTHVITCHAR